MPDFSTHQRYKKPENPLLRPLVQTLQWPKRAYSKWLGAVRLLEEAWPNAAWDYFALNIGIPLLQVRPFGCREIQPGDRHRTRNPSLFERSLAIRLLNCPRFAARNFPGIETIFRVVRNGRLRERKSIQEELSAFQGSKLFLEGSGLYRYQPNRRRTAWSTL